MQVVSETVSFPSPFTSPTFFDILFRLISPIAAFWISDASLMLTIPSRFESPIRNGFSSVVDISV